MTKLDFIPGLIVPPERWTVPIFGAQSDGCPECEEFRFETLPSSDQGNTPQCAAYAAAGKAEHWLWKRFGLTNQVDPNPIYKHAKTIDGFPSVEGTTAKAVVQALHDLNIAKVDFGSIREFKTVDEAIRAMHRYGPVLGGFLVTDRWTWAGKDGWIEGGGEVLGPHMVLLTGYNAQPRDGEPYISFQNSWGKDKGWRGYARMEFDVARQQLFTGYGFDFMA